MTNERAIDIAISVLCNHLDRLEGREPSRLIGLIDTNEAVIKLRDLKGQEARLLAVCMELKVEVENLKNRMNILTSQTSRSNVN